MIGKGEDRPNTTPVTPRARILLVDDYRDALDMWGIYLRSCGYDVLTAADGLAAVSIALEARPDVCVLDLDLPGLTGIEAARTLREAPATSRTILVAATGYSHAALLDEARQAGFESILVKPCEPTRLVEEIERLLEARRAAAGSE